MLEIITFCWLVLLTNGDAYCYCEGETPPPDIAVVVVLDESGRPKEEPLPIP